MPVNPLDTIWGGSKTTPTVAPTNSNTQSLDSIWNTTKANPVDSTSKLDDLWNKSQQPAMPAQPKEESPSIGGFVNNLVSDTGGVIKSGINALLHPIKTVEGVGKLAAGAIDSIPGVDKIMESLAAGGKDNSVLQSNKQAFNNFLGSYAEKTGIGLKGANAQSIIEHLAKYAYTNPAQFALDLSVLAGGAGAVGDTIKGASLAGDAAKAGLTAEEAASLAANPEIAQAGALGKTAQVGQGISDVAKMANPMHLAGEGVKVATNAVSPKIAELTSGLMDKAGVKAQGDLKNFWESTMRGTKSGDNLLEESLANGKDPAQFLADKKIVPEINGTKFNTQSAIDKVTASEAPLNKVMRQVLEDNPTEVNINDLRQKVLDAMDNSTNKAKNLTGDLQKQVNDEFNQYQKSYASDEIKAEVKSIEADKTLSASEKADAIQVAYDKATFKQTDLQDIKIGKAQQSRIFDQTRPQWRSNVDYTISKTARQTIEDSTKDVNVKALNKYIGDHEDTINMLQKLDGQTVKGGRLSKYVGTAIGATLGNTLPGKIAGALGGNYVADAIMNLSVDNPLRNYLLKYAETNEPEVMAEVKAMMEKQGKTPPPDLTQGATPKTTPEGTPQASNGATTSTDGRGGIKPLGQAKITDATQFTRAKDIPYHYKQIESKAFDQVLAHEDEILADYKAKPNGDKVVNPDEFKKYFGKDSPYDVGYTGDNAAAVQEPSSYLAKRAATDNYKNNPEPLAGFYAGSSGSGKSSAIASLKDLTDLKAISANILDSNLSSATSGDKIQEAIDAGKQPYTAFVARNPMDALHGVLDRMINNPEEGGRSVPTKIIAENMLGSWKNVSETLPKRFPGLKQYFIDNFTLGGDPKFITKDEMAAKLNYPSEAELTDMFNKEVTRLYNNPNEAIKLYGKEITKEQYAGLTK